jgi:hypothetical protein
MKILGFNLTKVSIEKNSGINQDLKINTKINVSDISEVKSSFFKIKEEPLGVKFSYEIDYSPDFAKIEIEGVILLAVDPKVAREVLNKWKDKLIPEDFKIDVFNLILKKSTLKALELEEEMNLPLHMPMPMLGKPNPQQDNSNQNN